MSFHACTGLPWGLLTLYKVGSIVEDGVSLLILWNKAYSNLLSNSRERSSVCRAAHRAVSLTSYKPFGLSSYLTTNIINCYSHSRMSRPAGISLRIPFQSWRRFSGIFSVIIVEYGVRLAFASWAIYCKAFCINRSNYGVECISFVMETLYR
jgi:hypothetical protein